VAPERGDQDEECLRVERMLEQRRRQKKELGQRLLKSAALEGRSPGNQRGQETLKAS